MKKVLVGKNIVFAGLFQTQKFDKFFFIKNTLFKEEEILPSSLFNSDGVQLLSDDISVIVLINQIIVTELKEGNNKIKNIASILINLVKPFVSALGINFGWNVSPEKSLHEDTKLLFFNEGNKIMSTFFNTENSMYGSYASKDFKSGRLKLDIKPQTLKQIQPIEVSTEVINYGFNFHFEIGTVEKYDIFIEAISDYDFMLKESEKIISEL